MGIKICELVDDLFVSVVLPDSWQKEPTDNSLWSSLVDEQGRDGAAIFYKSVFCGREDFMCLNRRYNITAYNQCSSKEN